MNVAHASAQTKAISEEERGLLAKTLDDTLDAISLEQAIARAPRSKKDAAARTWAMGDTLGKLVRNLLKLWEGKGEAEDDAIHKTMPELVLELGSTERKIRTAIRTGLEEGILEARPGYRPSDRRQTVYYTLKVRDGFTEGGPMFLTYVEGGRPPYDADPEDRHAEYRRLELRVVAHSKEALEVSGVFGTEMLSIYAPSST